VIDIDNVLFCSFDFKTGVTGVYVSIFISITGRAENSNVYLKLKLTIQIENPISHKAQNTDLKKIMFLSHNLIVY